ncbi:MAG: Flp pilus assembly protein CpaB [Hyphomonadaceae bacterium]|nr:Flp pilus assembly protein CpaB [Hyphomonadaceae bacterium]
MSARQLIVLAVAAIAAIGALLLIRGMGGRQSDPAEVADASPIGGEQVLVVTRDIPQGAALVPSDIEVRLFPNDSVSPQMINATDNPSAQAEYVGAVTRRPFVQGEPIIQGAVVQPANGGFMAAMLTPGFRAVAIEINNDTAVGGFVQPNDHVDVILTAMVNGAGGREEARSSIVLEDIRVLALNDVVQPQTSGDTPTRTEAQVAVLELSPDDARVLAQADGAGDVSLALRSVEAETVGMHTPRAQRSTPGGGGVRIHAFGSVQGGGS